MVLLRLMVSYGGAMVKEARLWQTLPVYLFCFGIICLFIHAHKLTYLFAIVIIIRAQVSYKWLCVIQLYIHARRRSVREEK